MAPKPDQKPDAFLSYTRFDNEFSGGAISKFRNQLAAHIRALTGKPFDIFQDVDGIGLGEHWPKKLDDMLNQTRFFMPILTPSFFESQPCRSELEAFLNAEAKAGRADLILPIYWTEGELLDEETLRSEDALAVILHERQHHDWRPLVFEAFESAEVQKSLQALARKIRTAKRRVIRVVADNQQVTASGGSRAQVQVVEPQVPPEAQVSDPLLLAPGTMFRDVDEPWCPEMMVVPAGTFLMGSPSDEIGRYEDEGPQRRVEIRKPFALGCCPVTCDEYSVFVYETGHVSKGAHILKGSEWKFDEDATWHYPGFEQTDRHPVVCVSHNDAISYLIWLSNKTGNEYVLPSEAMWEFACRAGTMTPFNTGETISTDQANYDDQFHSEHHDFSDIQKMTTEVRRFPANTAGLFDIHGNVWEWCADRWHQNCVDLPQDGSAWINGRSIKRVLRGGSWDGLMHDLRSARRYAYSPESRSSDIGFRCARVQK